MDSRQSMHRREFLERTAVAGGLAATLSAASWARVVGANKDIGLGVIGCGPRGQQLARALRVRGQETGVTIRRVCDLYRPRLSAAAELAGLPPAGATMEYREVLDDPDIDAVLIATPDHWHAKLSIEALEAGKAVLVETPLSHTIEEARAVRDAVGRTGGVFAVAAQKCSNDGYWKLREAIAQDRIGKVTWSQAAFCLNSRIPVLARPDEGPVSPRPDSPDYLWWDRWVGHEWGLAPRAEISPDRFFRYQKFYDYSGGLASEWLFGTLAPLLLAIKGPDGEQPRRVVCGGGLYNLFDTREVPDQLMAVIDYSSEHTIVLAASATNETGLEAMVRGRHGSATLRDEDVLFEEERAFYPEFRGGNKDLVDAGMSQDQRGRWIPNPPKGEVSFTLAKGERPDILDNFVAAVRGEAAPECGIELAYSTMVAIKMIVESLRQDRVMLWDRDAQRVTD